MGMVFGLLFWAAVIGLIVWLVTRSKKPTAVDYTSKTYAQGYWDGWRAREAQIGQPTQPAMTALIEDLQPTTVDYPAPQTHVDPGADKKRRELQNINIVLYVASFLLVAAAALFIGTSLPGEVKFIGTWVITLVFYIAGLALYKTSPKLRPAAVAFTGTGLALLPFTGLSMYNYILHDGPTVWLITSVIGVVAYVFATIRLQSQVVAYFALAFMISLSTAGVAVLQAGLLWYFVVLIGFGSIVTIIATLRPAWLPAVFTKPIQTSSTIIVPATLFLSLFAGYDLTVEDYKIIFVTTTLYYAAVAFSAVSNAMRTTAHIAARSLATVFVLLSAYDATHEWWIVGVALTGVAVLQVGVSAFAIRSGHKDLDHEVWIWTGLALLVVAPVFVAGTSDWAVITSYQLATLLATSIVTSMFLRRSNLLFFGLFALTILPVVVLFAAMHPAVGTEWASLLYLTCAALALYARKTVMRTGSATINTVACVACGVFLTEALLFVVGQQSQLWTVVLVAAASLIAYAIVYVEKKPPFMVLANILLIFTLAKLLDLVNMPYGWHTTALGWLVFAAFYAGYWLLVSLGKKQYATFMFWFAVVFTMLAGIGGISQGDNGVVVVSAGALGLVSLLLLGEGMALKKYGYIDAAVIIATIALQRIVAVVLPDIDGLIYSQWWAMVFAGLAYLYYAGGRRHQAKVRLIIGLSILSFFSGIAALTAASADGTLPYKLIFLLEHAGLLVIGLVASRKLLSIWGTVGVVLAVMWLLSGYTYVLLALIALALIGLVVYRLTNRT